MKCCNCGNLLPEDSEFCQYCGKKVEDAIANKTTGTTEIDSPNLTDETPEDVLDAVVKILAEETFKNFTENEKNQPNNEDDVDFGLVPEKPIYTLALMSVDGEGEYLNQLYTDNGTKIKWCRRGSISVVGVSGAVDVYDTYLPSGELYKTIYINMYGSKKSEKAPVGFALNNVETQRKQNSFKEEKQKTKFCKLCGNQIDSETKKCSGCGKQYFKGVKFNKFLTTVLILSFVILVSGIINIVQLVKINGLYDDKEHYMEKYNDTNREKEYYEEKYNKINKEYDFYHAKAVIVPDDATNLYHSYGCKDLDLSSYWVYNKEAAKWKKFKPCPNCRSIDEYNDNNNSITNNTQKKQSVQSTIQNNSQKKISKKTCISALCENEVSGSNSYCYEHKCYWPDCILGRSRGSYYCLTHTCNDVGCNNPIIANYKSYCESHTCYYPGCTSGQSFNSVYCIRHK